MAGTLHSIGIVSVCAVVTAVLRFLPFIVFPEGRKMPKILIYLSNVLPAALMGMLVVYCFREVSVISSPYGIPELIATAVTVLLYVWRKSFLLSVASGVVLYMILVQIVFV